jgi:hypothetical protein
MLKKTNLVIIGKKSANHMIGKKGGHVKSVIQKQMDNQYNQRSPLEK